jgi:hypothetical protein
VLLGDNSLLNLLILELDSLDVILFVLIESGLFGDEQSWSSASKFDFFFDLEILSFFEEKGVGDNMF